MSTCSLCETEIAPGEGGVFYYFPVHYNHLVCIENLRRHLEVAKEKYAAAWELCAEIDLELFGPSDKCPDLQAASALIGHVVLPPYTPERHTWKARALAAEARAAELEDQNNTAYNAVRRLKRE